MTNVCAGIELQFYIFHTTLELLRKKRNDPLWVSTIFRQKESF